MKLTNFFFEYRPHKKGLQTVLGELEAQIMEMMWAIGAATARDIYEDLRTNRKIAYTTVGTTMKRLSEKGLLTIEKQGTAFVFSPALSCSEFIQHVIDVTSSSLQLELKQFTLDAQKG